MNKERILFLLDVDLSFIICFFPDDDCILSCFSHRCVLLLQALQECVFHEAICSLKLFFFFNEDIL
jgi:hypothetical protein